MRIFLLGPSYDGSGEYRLTRSDRNYLFRSLRLEEGSLITARDSEGNYFEAKLTGTDTLMLTPAERPEGESLSDSLSSYRGQIPDITLYQCICKGRKNEDIARMACEAGVRRIVFVESEFTQERALSGHALDRVTEIMRQAVQQSGSSAPVEVPRTIPFDSVLEEASGRKIILHQGQRSRTRSLYDAVFDLGADERVCILVGSEGGFSDSECGRAEESGFIPVLLSTNILRAETAGIFCIGAVESIAGRTLT